MTSLPAREDDSALDVNQAARLCGKSPETIRRWVRARKLAARRAGNRFLISRGDLEEVAADHNARPTTSLAQWALAAEKALRVPARKPGRSAAGLVLMDRRMRSEGPRAR